MTDRELMQQALKILKRLVDQQTVLQKEGEEITAALCERLAQPEQEPVAWARFSDKGNIIDLLNEPDRSYTPLYATPPRREWVGLTEGEIESLWEGNRLAISYARAIETKLKEKNNGTR